MRKQAYIAAANRAKYVVENYPKTPAVLDALKLLTEAYTKLDMHDLARDTQRVLDLNLPKQAKSTSGTPAVDASGSAKETSKDL